MSQRSGVLVTFILFFLLASYLVYESAEIVEIRSFDEFLHAYIYSIQKVSLNINLFLTLFAYFTKSPYYKPEYLTRYSVSLLYRLYLRLFIQSAFVALYCCCVFFMLSTFYLDFPFHAGAFIQCVMLIFLFSFFWLSLSALIYCKTNREIVGILVTFAVCLLVSILFSNMEFNGVFVESGYGAMQVFLGYLSVAGLCNSVLLAVFVKRRECIF